MTEQDLLEQIECLESSIKVTRKKITEILRSLDNEQSELIELKVKRDRLIVQLAEYREVTPQPSREVYDLEIEQFRLTYPELCQMARKRDSNKY